MNQTQQTLLDQLGTRAEKADVFGDVTVSANRLQCAARDAAEPAWYRVDHCGKVWEISLVTADRWLSESIEADLMHHGDPLEELIEEELAELGFSGDVPPVKHYRSDDMFYTFRSQIPTTGDDKADLDLIMQWLLGYEAAFRELGDMSGDDED